MMSAFHPDSPLQLSTQLLTFDPLTKLPSDHLQTRLRMPSIALFGVTGRVFWLASGN